MQELHIYEKLLSLDYRFNHQLAAACDEDIARYCGKSCDFYNDLPCYGTVTKCLVARHAHLRKPSCRQEVELFMLTQVQLFSLLCPAPAHL